MVKLDQQFEENINPFTGEISTPEIAKITQEDYLASKPKSETGIISTKQGERQVAKDKQFMENTYPDLPPIETSKEVTKETPKESGKAYFVNLSGQEFEATPEQMQDPQTKSFLESGGYKLSKSDFPVGEEYTTTGLQQQVDEREAQIEGLVEDFLSYNVEQDPDFQREAQNIKSEFDKMRKNMQKINYQRQRAFETLGYRTGATQYMGGTQMGIEGEELSQGNERLSEITRQESKAISDARVAFKTGNYEEYNVQVAALKDLREMKAQKLADYNTAIANFNKKLQDEQANLLKDVKLGLEIEKLKQDMVQSNLDTYSSLMISYDEDGNLVIPDEEELNQYAQELGVSPNILVGTIRNKYQELSKLGQEDQLRELNIMKAMADLQDRNKTELIKNYEYAVENNGFTGSVFDFQKEYEASKSVSQPASYKEWELAGGKAGTGKTYAEFLGGNNGLDSKTITQVDKISSSFDSAPIVKNYNDVINKKLSIDSILEAGIGGPGDLALVFEFMKALDPTSVVRESEYESASKSGNIFAGVFTRFNKGYFDPKGGILPEEVKKSFKEIVDRKLDVIQRQYDNLRNEKARLINQKIGSNDGADYLIDYDVRPKESDKYVDIDTFSEQASAEEIKELLDLQSVFPDLLEEDLFEQFRQSKGFSQPLSMGEKGLEVMKIASAIGQFESGGNYKAIGPATSSGDKAYGKYQIMGNNIPGWSKEALGYSISKEEFLNNFKLQDKIAQYKMGQYYDKYGSVADVATAWFAGPGAVGKNSQAKDVVGTSVPKYIQNVLANYNKLS